jgi:DNA-binding CsgD family transcriptional regulator
MHLSNAYLRLRRRGTFTHRECEVLNLVADGMTNREVARRLDISPGTARAHLEHIYGKLGVGTRTAAIGGPVGDFGGGMKRWWTGATWSVRMWCAR